MLDDIGALYQNEIDRLNEMGENDLEITEMPLKAKTLSKQVWEQGMFTVLVPFQAEVLMDMFGLKY